MIDREAMYRELMQAARGVAGSCPGTGLDRFRRGFAQADAGYEEVEPCYLPAASLLSTVVDTACERTRSLCELADHYREQLFWEQSYRIEDNVVSKELLSGYAFAEFMGKNGPLVSQALRCGIGIWSPQLTYPTHHHQAEEIYLVLAGSARFNLEGEPPRRCEAGEVVYVYSGRPHGFYSGARGLVVLYLWQGGDLREISSFP